MENRLWGRRHPTSTNLCFEIKNLFFQYLHLHFEGFNEGFFLSVNLALSPVTSLGRLNLLSLALPPKSLVFRVFMSSIKVFTNLWTGSKAGDLNSPWRRITFWRRSPAHRPNHWNDGRLPGIDCQVRCGRLEFLRFDPFYFVRKYFCK